MRTKKKVIQPDLTQQCVDEVNAILRKYNCRIDVQFSDAIVLGRTMMEYKAVINPIKKS